MPRVQVFENGLNLWISARETEEWAAGRATFGEGRWPCSDLSGHRVFAQFDSNGLVDLAIDGKDSVDIDANEFNALTSSALKEKVPLDHPCRFVAVDQFFD